MSHNNKEVAHLWAHQSGSRATGSNLSFDGPVLRSYSTAIGELLEVDGAGMLAVLNADSYSVSTSRHQSYMRQAISHLPSVEVWGTGLGEGWLVPKTGRHADRVDKKWVKQQIQNSLSKAAERMEKAGRARNPDVSFHLESQADYLVRNAKTLAEWFKVKFTQPALPELVARAAEIRKQEAIRRKRLEAKLEKENAEKIAAWQNGESSELFYSLAKVYLRRRNPGLPESMVETSKGAIIPWDDAVKLFRFAQAKRKKGWRRNGETFAIGCYQLDSVTKDGIVAGCHHISFKEIERLAKKEGVT